MENYPVVELCVVAVLYQSFGKREARI